MDYKETFTEMLEEFGTEIGRYRSGEKAQYFYKCKHTENYGDVDENYGRRGRVLYGLRLGAAQIDEPEREQMVRELFVQEIIAREKSSFQGIGANLELIALLMEQYRKPEDEALYQRAKNANYDCYCGFMTDGSYADQYPADIFEYSLEEGISIANDLGMKDKVLRLVDVFKAEGLDGERIFRFKYFAEMTGRPEDREIAVKGCYKHAFDGDASDMKIKMHRLTAAKGLIKWLCENGGANEAFGLLKKHTDVLRSANGKAFFEAAQDIMTADNGLIRDVWGHISMYLAKDITDGKLYPVCLVEAKNCAEMAGAKLTVRQIDKMHKKDN
ncbi:hypothetical protein [Ruminococcus albus]|uniref:Uncharacterized protein n=1 Tax=Ruminococcus albus TaxID=1264 RepID=A0A1I1NU71_RUMAL|nr:hypothetical protein [Ruminococcus albus]SFD01211.1 hypothetical protein SAMN02910406_02869 [Ruminococcus albus]